MIHTHCIEVPEALHALDAASIAVATLAQTYPLDAIGAHVRWVWVTTEGDGWVIQMDGPCPDPSAQYLTIHQVLAW